MQKMNGSLNGPLYIYLVMVMIVTMQNWKTWHKQIIVVMTKPKTYIV